MIANRLLPYAAALAFSALTLGCTQKNSGDESSSVADVPVGLERFLLFPNPVGQDALAPNGGTFETNTTEYAAAYYRAIDPPDISGNSAKDTLAEWKTANGFGSGTGTEHLAVFRDAKDLGYGRRMTGRRNTDGSVAFYVENYSVAPNGSPDYSSELNVEAAIRRDTQWHVGTNAIEWSAAPCSAAELAEGCNPTVKFAKYYNFSSKDGTRQLAVDLDGKGLKAMPGPCITCHGGRGDPLTPPEASTLQSRFPLVENSLSRKRGDVQARLQGMNVDSFGYSASQPGFSKADQQGFLKDFNQWILCTYPSPTGAAVTGGWGSCTRTTAGANEWQGTAGEMIEAWYGGAGMPAANFSDTYVPAGWNTNVALYQNVVAPYCRTCHSLRGTKNQDDIDFTKLGTPAAGPTPATGFLSYADRIKAHVFDRGTMPLALIVYDAFWKSSAPQQLATFIDSVLGAGTVTSASGAALMPGRPIADPGPDRMVRTGANAVLTAENSLFASTFGWSMVSGAATIANPNSMVAIFNAPVAGTYVVRLTVGNGASTPFKDVTITVDDDFPDPLNIKFAHVKNVLQNIVHATAQKCTNCHISPAVSPTPPIFYNNFDRDGIGGIDATDDAWFLKALGGRVNLTEIEASPLLRKPSGNHHNGGKLLDVATAAGLRNYSILYNWILAGMQPGGVAANAVVNGGAPISPLTFSGTPPLATGIALNGSQSVGATNFLWTVDGPSGPVGTLASVSNPTSPSGATLNLPYFGDYVVSLQVDDGVSSDTVQQTVTVTETPVVANFVPATGNASVTFTGNPLRGNINLTSTSSGSPTTCTWQVTGPAGATLDGVAVPTSNPPATVPKTCGTPAVLDVPATSLNGVYTVTLTATSSLGTSGTPVTHNLTVQSAGSGVTAVISSPTAGNRSTTFTGTSTVPTTDPISTNISLTGIGSTGPGTLAYQWSVTAGPAGSVIASPTSANTTMTVTRLGTYTVQLFVSNGLPPGPSNTATVTFTAIANGTTFSQVWPLFQSFGAGLGCTGCHGGTGNPAVNSGTAPGWEVPNPPNATDINNLYTRVFARVDTGTPKLSLLLLNPSDSSASPNVNGHGGGLQTGFDLSGTHNNYDLFLNWIMGGAPNN